MNVGFSRSARTFYFCDGAATALATGVAGDVAALLIDGRGGVEAVC